MDAVTLGAIGTIAVGLASATAAIIGQRGANRANQAGAVLGGYGTLVDNLQEERDKIRERLAETERQLTEAYRDLADARAEKAELLSQIHDLTAERDSLIAQLGGQPT